MRPQGERRSKARLTYLFAFGALLSTASTLNGSRTLRIHGGRVWTKASGAKSAEMGDRDGFGQRGPVGAGLSKSLAGAPRSSIGRKRIGGVIAITLPF